MSEEVKVNVNETEEDFFNEETVKEETFEEQSTDQEQPKKEEETKKGFFDKGIFGWFKKHWKLAVSLGLVSIVGGVVFVYWMGKKPVKIGKINDVARAIGDTDQTDVIDFVEAAKELAKKDDESKAVNG